MTFSPIITVSLSPSLQIEVAGGISYKSILQELGYTVIKANRLYYWASTMVQFNNPITYLIYEVDGQLQQALTPTPIDPHQFATSMILMLKEKDKPGALPFIFNGTTWLSLYLEANSSLQFIFDTVGFSVKKELNEFGPDNFTKLADTIDQPDFFKGYKDEL